MKKNWHLSLTCRKLVPLLYLLKSIDDDDADGMACIVKHKPAKQVINKLQDSILTTCEADLQKGPAIQ